VHALADLEARWRRARRAALRCVVREADGSEPEDALLREAIGRDAVTACARVFDNSLRLGHGFTRFHAKELALGELPGVLSQLRVACLQGTWRAAEGEPAMVLEREACVYVAEGAGACSYWRDAIEGLVLGITGGVRCARHESRGHGGARCVDVVYVRPESPLRFGPIADEQRAALEGARRRVRAFDSSVDVVFHGALEGVIHYEVKANGCGGNLAVASMVARELARRLPGVAFQDTAQRSPFDTELKPSGATHVQ
jgi:hypothetical protein